MLTDLGDLKIEQSKRGLIFWATLYNETMHLLFTDTDFLECR